MNRIMNLGRYIPDHAVTTVPVLAVLFAVHFFFLRADPVDDRIEATSVHPSFYQHWLGQAPERDFDIDAELERLSLDDAARDRRIRELLEAGQYQHARTLLLEIAAAAVLQENQQRLGDTLMLLGEVAIYQQELAASEIYLQEALYLTMSRDDAAGTARCYQLLGELNIRARELARYAANTYDQLWQARNMIARGLYQGVGESLQHVIERNLEIRRYGAAADAWEALAALHDKLHDSYPAQRARIEAARLFAATGQATHVQRLFDELDPAVIGEAGLAEARGDVDALFEQHQQDQVRTSQARDYQMLYHHYLRLDQPERAWQMRIQASKTLASTSDRALFQRQADIIAVLYNSNFAMQRAREFLGRADSLFDEQGIAESRAQNRALEARIY